MDFPIQMDRGPCPKKYSDNPAILIKLRTPIIPGIRGETDCLCWQTMLEMLQNGNQLFH